MTLVGSGYGGADDIHLGQGVLDGHQLADILAGGRAMFSGVQVEDIYGCPGAHEAGLKAKGVERHPISVVELHLLGEGNEGGLEQIGGEIIQIDAGRFAEQTGNTMTVNIVMLGALAASGALPISFSAIEEAVKTGVPPKTVAVNLQAFHLGAGALTETET